jgi:hypothetical protein
VFGPHVEVLGSQGGSAAKYQVVHGGVAMRHDMLAMGVKDGGVVSRHVRGVWVCLETHDIGGPTAGKKYMYPLTDELKTAASFSVDAAAGLEWAGMRVPRPSDDKQCGKYLDVAFWLCDFNIKLLRKPGKADVPLDEAIASGKGSCVRIVASAHSTQSLEYSRSRKGNEVVPLLLDCVLDEDGKITATATIPANLGEVGNIETDAIGETALFGNAVGGGSSSNTG